MSPKRDIINWQSMADPAIVREIGQYLQQMRLNKNLSQRQLAEISGVNRVTISRMEGGRAATLLTIVQILRALGKLDILNIFYEDARVSPLQLLQLKKNRRQRATGTRKSINDPKKGI
ncbi:MAG: helix-turn-helix transcriptional regulator [Candidatus Zixiibacteriota bacterium]